MAADIVYAELVKRQVNWGDANKSLVKIVAHARSELQRAQDRINQRLSASHESEMASRRAAAAALNTYRPITCSTVGSLTTCY